MPCLAIAAETAAASRVSATTAYTGWPRYCTKSFGEYWVVFYDCADVVQAGHGFSAVAIDYARHGANDVE